MTNEAKAELRKVWEARVAEFRASGLSMSKWCEQHDLKLNQLRYWLKTFPPGGKAGPGPVAAP